MQSLCLLMAFSIAVGRVAAAKTNLVENTFATDAEGWQSVDLPDGAGIGDPAPAIPALWTNAPAVFGPSLVLADASSGTIFFSAPPPVVARLGALYGSFLEFELATTHRSWTGSDFVVIRGLVNGQARAVAGALPRLPGEAWTPYSLRLVAASFRYNDKSGPAIAPRDFRELLRSATALWLPAEFGAGVVETTHLRNVKVSAEPLLTTQCVPALTLDGFVGQEFRIEYQEVLGTSAWQHLTNVTLTAAPFRFIDLSALDGLQRYYRAIELP